jgi:dienelactone hydrolase
MKFATTLIISLFVLSGCANMQTPEDGRPPSVSGVLLHKDGPKPTVIIAHGCDGNSGSGSYRGWAIQARMWGYNAVVSDSFGPRNVGNVCHSPMRVTPTQRANDLIEIAEYIKKQPWHTGNIVAIGFSHGGSTVLNIGSRTKPTGISAVVSFYPHCSHVFVGENVFDPQIPVQIHAGSSDDWCPPGICQIYFDNPKKEHYLYTGATHAFDMPYPPRNMYGHYMSYDGKADALSKERTKQFLKKHLE